MRWWRSVLVVGLLASVGVFVRAAPACACSCVAFTDEEALASADAVFAGWVVGIHSPATGPIFSSADPVTVTFEVRNVYKGDVAAEARVHTVASEVSCGYEFHVGTRYLVHVHVDQTGQWTTGLCSNNKILPREAGTQPAGEQTTAPELGPPTVGHPPTPVTQPPAQPMPWALLAGAATAAAAIGILLLIRARRRPVPTSGP